MATVTKTTTKFISYPHIRDSRTKKKFIIQKTISKLNAETLKNFELNDRMKQKEKKKNIKILKTATKTILYSIT